jgi:cysteine desulfurase
MKVYLDNAATTPPYPEVVECMVPYLSAHFGNPSSTHSFGRDAKSAIEKSRKKIAELTGAGPSEIYFTSGGTEADNMALNGFIDAFGLKTLITSPVEHHAILHTAAYLEKMKGVQVLQLDVDESGSISLDELEEKLKAHPSALVTLMHANNEIGNLTGLENVANICRQYKTFFYSDTVQTIGKIAVDAKITGLDGLAGSAHKFHGPKGVGFLYIRGSSKIGPYLHGGGQERNLRSGTENVAGIVGMAKALELSCVKMEENKKYISGLKSKMIARLKSDFPDVRFNGLCEDLGKSLYTILNVSLPPADDIEMLLFQLDLHQIAASGGSACASGALMGSHVLEAIRADPARLVVRFSFSQYNKPEEIDYTMDTLKQIFHRP